MAQDILIAEYDAALASERKDRAVAVLGLPELIAGIRVEPLTPRRLEWLRAFNNPFVCGGEVTPEALLQFMWFVGPHFAWDASEEKRIEFVRRGLALDVPEIREGIEEYLDRAFLDAPNGSVGISYYAPTAGLYHTLNEYFPNAGWTLNTVLDAPLRVIYQLIKCADKSKGCVVMNRRSDAVKGRMLDAVESWDVDTEAEIDPFIEMKRAEGFGLFSDPMKRGDKWTVTMRRISNAR